MTDRINLELFGGFRSTLGDGRPYRLPTRKSEGLFAYLAVPAGQFYTRDSLAALLWGETEETQARQSLRQAVLSIRKMWGRSPQPILLTRGDSIALNPELVLVDAAELEAALADGRREVLEQAVLLRKGSFLEGLRIDEPRFDEWRAIQTARLDQIALEALDLLLRRQRELNLVDSAIQTAMRTLSIEPLHEAAHRALMRLLLGQGRRAAALQQYQTCVGMLQRELGAEPEEETKQLYREILRTSWPPARRLSERSLTVLRTSPATRSHELRLVGREAELAYLTTSFARAFDQCGRVVLLNGEAGIGKSRLVGELARLGQAGGAWVAIGRCHESESVLPLHPLVDALRRGAISLDARIRDRLAASVSGQLARVFPELREPEDEPVTSSEQHTLLFDALIELILQFAVDRPIVFIIEDLHWADAMSARFVAFLARRIHLIPALLVLSLRPEEVVDAPVAAQVIQELKLEGLTDELRVGPLTRDGSDKLLRELLGARYPAPAMERAAEEIWSISQGNPFVIVESVRDLQQSRAAVPRLSARVEESVERRLDRLDAATRHILNIAALIGRDFSFELIRRAAGVSQLRTAAAIDELVRRRILDSVGERLDFCHEWIRRVANHRMLPALKTSAHMAIAKSLEYVHRRGSDEVANEIAEHYWQAGDQSHALPHLARFAEMAVQRYALDDALAALARASACTEHLPDAERDRWQLDFALRQAFILSLQGRQREILALLRDRASLVRQVDDPALSSDYYSRLGLVHWYRGEHAEAELVAMEALRAAQRAHSPERAGRAEYVLALNCAGLGLPKKGVAHATRAVANLDAPRTRHWGGLAHFALALNQVIAGELDGAQQAARRCTEIGEAEHDSRLTSGGRYIIAWVQIHRGEFAAAMDAAAGTLECARDAVAMCLANGVMGWAALEQGNTSAAISHLQQAVDKLHTMPLRLTEARFLSLLSEAHLHAGDTAQAAKNAARARDLSRADGNPFTRALAERALGRLARVRGELASANRLFSRALRRFEAVGARIEAAQTRVDVAIVLDISGDCIGASEHLQNAVACFNKAGAVRRAVIATELAAAQGTKVTAVD